MKNFLFPIMFRIIGWILFVPGLVAAALLNFGTCPFYGVAETIFIDTTVIAIVMGALFIVCSKERQEDEMTRAIRLSSLLNALYAYVAVVIIGTLCINGIEYLKFLMFSLVLLPMIFVIIFRAEMHRFYKQNADEE